MTLTDLLPIVQQLSVSEKITLIRILAQELDNKVSIFPLEPYKTYDLPTPHNTFGAGEALMKTLNTEN